MGSSSTTRCTRIRFLTQYVGYRGNTIIYVGSQPPSRTTRGLGATIKLPKNLEGLSPAYIRKNYIVKRGKIVDCDSVKRLAFVSPYGIRCGISTYSEHLWTELAKLVPESRLFAEKENPNYEARPVAGTFEVVRCWERGRPLTELVEALRDYDPDAVYIQHEYGIFPAASHWLSFISAISDLHTVVTLHSVYRHLDKTIVEASIPDIVVHSEGARNILVNEKKVGGRVHIIPHGTEEQTRDKFWNLYRTPHTLIQAGFGFSYKGWDSALELVSILKDQYPDVFFTGLFSETKPNANDADWHRIQEQIDDLGIREHVGMVRGFQSDVSLDAYLRTNSVAVLPYVDNGPHTVYGTSGIARLIMSKGVPLVTSDVPLFEDLAGVVAQAATPELMAREVSRIFDEPQVREDQLTKQATFLSQHTWSVTAERYLDLTRSKSNKLVDTNRVELKEHVDSRRSDVTLDEVTGRSDTTRS